MLPIDTKSNINAVQDSMFDSQGLNSIKAMGRDKNPESIRAVAKQFEAMFMQQMLKTMRDTNNVFAEGNFLDSSQVRFHRDMMDQQMVLNLSSGKGIGLAEQFYQSMMQAYGKDMNKPESADESDTLKSSDTNEWMNSYYKNTPPQAVQATSDKSAVSQSQQDFVSLLKPHAEKAARALNLSPEVLIAQAALETGWGKHVIHSPKGENSFNLFNIKAGNQWQGKSINVSTQEVNQGVTYYERADFKKYNSYAESFADYVRLIKNNSRYQQALSAGKDSGAYAQELQKAGYATDPDYADKIKSLLKTEAISAMASVGQSARSLLTLTGQLRQQLME
jgi:flagellar protein FlgJ